jgi:DNA/RNA-binding domain of Phe-tRNA-synthetase-like protein
VKLLGEQEARAPYPGEVIYKDEEGTLCRRWNWKEAERTKLTEQTTDAIIVMEGLPPIDKEKVQNAIEELVDLVQKYCGGESAVTILHKEATSL